MATPGYNYYTPNLAITKDPTLSHHTDLLSLKRNNANEVEETSNAKIFCFDGSKHQCGFNEIIYAFSFNAAILGLGFMWFSTGGFPVQFAIPCIILYLLSFCFAGGGPVVLALRNKMSKAEVNAKIQAMKAQPVYIYVDVECYHVEARSSGSGDDRRTEHVKVTTFSSRQQVPIRSTLDLSKSKIGFGTFQFVLVRQNFDIFPGEAHHETLLENLAKEHEKMHAFRDEKIDVTIDYYIDGIDLRSRSKSLDSVTEQGSSGCISTTYIVLFNALLLAPLYFLWFYLSGAAGEVLFEHKKAFFIDTEVDGGVINDVDVNENVNVYDVNDEAPQFVMDKKVNPNLRAGMGNPDTVSNPNDAARQQGIYNGDVEIAVPSEDEQDLNNPYGKYPAEYKPQF
jgi:hypothetical protein